MNLSRFLVWSFILWSSLVSAGWAYTSNDYYQAGKKLYGTGDYANAVKYFAAAIKLDPKNTAALQARGNCYYTQGQYSYALTDYQQVQALSPSPQLAAFIEKVKVKAGVTGGVPPSMSSSAMNQGIAYYQQRQYSLAIDSFEQATQQDPQNYKPFYYLGLARLMNGDRRGATLSLAIANELHPNAGLAAYIEKLKAGLSGDDRGWVQVNLNSYDRNGGHHKANQPEKMIGIRIEPGLAMPGLGDFNTDAQTAIALGQYYQQSGYPSLQIAESVPSGYLDFTIEPTLKVMPWLELGLPIAILPVGNYTATVSGDGLSAAGTYSISGFGIGLNARAFYGDGPIKLFGAVGPMVAPLSLNFSGVPGPMEAIGLYTSPVSINGNTSSMAIGGQVQLGADLHLSDDLLVSVFGGYRFLSASGFSGNFTGASGTSEQGEFYMVQSSYGYYIEPLSSNQTSGGSGSNYRPLTVDLSGPILGLQAALYF